MSAGLLCRFADKVTDALLFRDVLEGEMGHEVVLMSFAPDELSRIIEEHPDLVVIDFVVGEREMDGWQLLQKLRMHPQTVGIPIVACTAAAKAVREQEAYLLEQGIEVVLKPFTIDQLEGAVTRALELTKAPGPRHWELGVRRMTNGAATEPEP